MELKNKTASICGCAKNIAEHLPLSISKIEMISSVFKEVKIFIFENDSTDDTLVILNQWASDNKSVEVISENNIPLKATKGWYKRVETLSYARNKVLEATKKYEPDYYIMIDLHEVISRIKPLWVLSQLECFVFLILCIFHNHALVRILPNSHNSSNHQRFLRPTSRNSGLFDLLQPCPSQPQD